jgi:hypothetical protein
MVLNPSKPKSTKSDQTKPKSIEVKPNILILIKDNQLKPFQTNGRIHNNDEGRWQHTELTGQHLRTKSVTS